MTNDVIEEGMDKASIAESSIDRLSTGGDAVQPSTAEGPAQNAIPELWSKRLAWIIMATMTAVMLTSMIYRPVPVKPGEEYFTVCGFKNLTGLPCPGCGLTHSFCEIGKGHLASAVNWNWLGLPLFLLIMLVWFQALFILTSRITPPLTLNRLAARLRPMRWFAIAFVLYGLGRIIYILIYDPSARVSSPVSRLFSLLTG